MAKEKKEEKEEHLNPPLEPRKRKKKKWLVILILLLIIGGALVFFRAPIMKALKNVPVIGGFIPDEVVEEKLSPEELQLKVSTQEKEIAKLEAEMKALEERNMALSEQNESLKQYESMYQDFIAQKEAWDEEVAKTNTELFIQQFESIYPDTAERIYQTLKGGKVLSDQQKELSKTIAGMDEDQAAKALELLISTDSELVQTIFGGMSADQQSIILSAMTSESAAQVIKLISPDENSVG